MHRLEKVTAKFVLLALAALPVEAADLESLRGTRQYACEAHREVQNLSLVNVGPSARFFLELPSPSPDLIPVSARTADILNLNSKYAAFVKAAGAFEKALYEHAKSEIIRSRYRAVYNSYAHMEAAFLAILSRKLERGEIYYLGDLNTKLISASKRNLSYYSIYAYLATQDKNFLIDGDNILYKDGALLFLISPHPKAGLRDGTGRVVPPDDYPFSASITSGIAKGQNTYFDKTARILTDSDAFFSLKLYLELSGPKRPDKLRELFADKEGYSLSQSALGLVYQTGNPKVSFPDVGKLDPLVRGCYLEKVSQFKHIMSFRAAYALATGEPADIDAALEATSVIAASARKRRYFLATYATAKFWELRLLERQRRLDATSRKQRIEELWATGVANHDPLGWYALCHLDQSKCK